MLTPLLLALALAQSPGQAEPPPRVIEVPMPSGEPPPQSQPSPAPQPAPAPAPAPSYAEPPQQLPPWDAGTPLPPPAYDAGEPDRGLPLTTVQVLPDGGFAPLTPLTPPPERPADTGIHFYGALELDITNEPSGPLNGGNDTLFGIRPIVAFDAGEWFEAELGAYFRLRMFDDPPENRPNDIGGVLRGADWDSASDFGQIIRRVRIAKENSPFYARLGVATRRTLGLGHLINRYSNQENPDYHPAALTAVIQGGPVRTEGFISDLFGARIYAGELTFDFGRLGDSPEQYDRWLFMVSLAGDAGLARYQAPGAMLFHSDFAAVIYRSGAAKILLETGFGARLDVRSDFGFVTGIAVDADLTTLLIGGKFEVRKQYGGFRHGYFGPQYELSRFASYAFDGPPQALELLPDNWSIYGELRIASGKIVSTDAAVEHFFYGRTDLDFSLALDLWDGRFTAISTFSVVGIGINPRFNTRTQARVRIVSFLYALAHGGIQLSPQPDWTLGRGVFFGLGVGADFRR